MQTEKHIRVVLADDHVIVRQGTKLILEGSDGILIVGEASDGKEAIELVNDLKPDVLVCDIAMPELSGIEVARCLKGTTLNTRIIFLTMQDKEEYILEAMKAGASGFLSKSAVSEELVEAIEKVAHGKEYFTDSVYAKMMKGLREQEKRPKIHLTPREKEVLKLLCEGQSTKMIAQNLTVSEYTISNHRANLLRKLSAQNTADLIRKALELKLCG